MHSTAVYIFEYYAYAQKVLVSLIVRGTNNLSRTLPMNSRTEESLPSLVSRIESAVYGEPFERLTSDNLVLHIINVNVEFNNLKRDLVQLRYNLRWSRKSAKCVVIYRQ